LRIRTTPEDFDLTLHLQRPHEVGDEEHRALQDSDQHEVLVNVVRRDLICEFPDAGGEHVGLNEHPADGWIVRH
jgi:hypothetical protein